jgi:hypothetical protein
MSAPRAPIPACAEPPVIGTITTHHMRHGNELATHADLLHLVSHSVCAEISRGLAAGLSYRRIAHGLGRPASTVSREVAANGRIKGYRAARADQLAWVGRPVPRGAGSQRIRCCVPSWRTSSFNGGARSRLPAVKVTYPDDLEMLVSHESIYRTLYVQSPGGLRKELTTYLRTGRVIRRPKGVRVPDGRGGRPNTLHISQRPAEMTQRLWLPLARQTGGSGGLRALPPRRRAMDQISTCNPPPNTPRRPRRRRAMPKSGREIHIQTSMTTPPLIEFRAARLPAFTGCGHRIGHSVELFQHVCGVGRRR